MWPTREDFYKSVFNSSQKDSVDVLLCAFRNTNRQKQLIVSTGLISSKRSRWGIP